MHSLMCVRLVACVVLVASASCHVIRSQQYPLSPAGLTIDVVVTDKGSHAPPHNMFNIDVNENTKKVTVTYLDVPKLKKPPMPVLHFITLDDRFNNCPKDHTRLGWYCVPDDILKEDDEYDEAVKEKKL